MGAEVKPWASDRFALDDDVLQPKGTCRQQCDPTVSELEGWIPTLDGMGTLVCTMSSTLMLTAVEGKLRTSALELEASSTGAEPPTTGFLKVVFSTSSSKSGRGCAFTLLAPPRLQPGLGLGLGFEDVFHVVFLASFFSFGPEP